MNSSDWCAGVRAGDGKLKQERSKAVQNYFHLPNTHIELCLYIIMIYDLATCRSVIREGNGTPLQSSCLENPMGRGAWWAAVQGVAKSQIRLSKFTFTFHFQAVEKEMAAHSSVLAWRIPGKAEPGGLLSKGSHRVRHDWSDLAAAAGVVEEEISKASVTLWLVTEIMLKHVLCLFLQ